MRPAELRAWRKRQRLTQRQAEVWYFGHDNGGRTWRRYEAGDSPIPVALVRLVHVALDPNTASRANRRLLRHHRRNARSGLTAPSRPV